MQRLCGLLRDPAQVVDIVRGQRVDGDHLAADGCCDLLCLAPVELGLYEDDADVLLPGPVDEGRQSTCAGLLALVLDRHLDQVVGIGKVAPGGMEDEKTALRQRVEQGMDVTVEAVELGDEGVDLFLVDSTNAEVACSWNPSSGCR